jgi:hypothetical protein
MEEEMMEQWFFFNWAIYFYGREERAEIFFRKVGSPTCVQRIISTISVEK